MRKDVEMSGLKGKEYKKVMTSSAHGQFSIEDEDEDGEITFDRDSSCIGNFSEVDRNLNGYRTVLYTGDKGVIKNALDWVGDAWSTLTFSWMENLLKKGNEKPLEMEDLYKLPYEDCAAGVYKRFKLGWLLQLSTAEKPSLTWAFFHAFGRPFLFAALPKLVHDSSLFVGPQLLNALINFLNDPCIKPPYSLFRLNIPVRSLIVECTQFE